MLMSCRSQTKCTHIAIHSQESSVGVFWSHQMLICFNSYTVNLRRNFRHPVRSSVFGEFQDLVTIITSDQRYRFNIHFVLMIKKDNELYDSPRLYFVYPFNSTLLLLILARQVVASLDTFHKPFLIIMSHNHK